MRLKARVETIIGVIEMNLMPVIIKVSNCCLIGLQQVLFEVNFAN